MICHGEDGLGWAWHEDERRRACFVGEIAAPAELVAQAIDGRELAGVDRLLAIVRLKEESPFGLQRLFRIECPACGADHYERAKRAIRVVPFIHEAAIERLRAARVPEHLLCEPRYRRSGETEPAADVKPKLAGLPVFLGNTDRTLAAQLAFARQYALKKGQGQNPCPP